MSFLVGQTQTSEVWFGLPPVRPCISPAGRNHLRAGPLADFPETGGNTASSLSLVPCLEIVERKVVFYLDADATAIPIERLYTRVGINIRRCAQIES